MDYVKRIVSNVKGTVAANLGPKTLIIGPNGSHKTAITQSVELALTGRASDVGGRPDVAIESQLITLAPAGMSLEIKATLASGGECIFAVKRKKDGKPSRATHSYPAEFSGTDLDALLPLRPFLEAVRGKPETLKKYLLAKATGTITTADVLAHFPQSFHRLYEHTVSMASSRDVADQLVFALENGREEAKKLAVAATTLQEQANELARAVGVPPIASVLKAAQDRKADAEARVRRAITAVASSAAQIKAREEQEEALVMEVTKGEALVASLSASLAASQPLPEIHQYALRTVIWHEEIARGDCIVCGSKLNGTARAERAEKAKAKLAAFEASRRLGRDLSEAESNLRRTQAALATLREEIKRLGAPDEDGEQLDVQEEQAKLEAAARDLQALRDSVRDWEQAQNTREAAAQKQAQAAERDQFVQHCAQALSLLLSAGVNRFERKVQEYLPVGDHFRLDLAAGCQIGIVREGVLHSALSGAEWARVTAALAAASRDPRAALGVVVVEDRGWDARTLALTLHALGAAPVQVLLATPTEPDGGAPAGWEVIRL